MWVPLVRKDIITWWHPRGLLSPSIFLGVTHAEWIENSGVFILFTSCPAFHCGTNEFIPGLSSDLFWLVGHLSLLSLLPSSYGLSLIINFIFIHSSIHPWNLSRVNKEPPTKTSLECSKGLSWCIIPYYSSFHFSWRLLFFGYCSFISWRHSASPLESLSFFLRGS